MTNFKNKERKTSAVYLTPAELHRAEVLKQQKRKALFAKWEPWLYLLPALILLVIFTFYPIINTFRIAMLEGYSAVAAKTAHFSIGFKNFTKVFKYKDFLNCLKTTILLTFITVPLSTIIALLVSVALNAIKPLKRLLQTIFFLPYVTNSVAIGMVFAAMFNIVGIALGTDNQVIVTAGIINNILSLFGVEPINWINAGSSYFNNMVVLVIYITWNALPFKILILLGGLQSINKQYYDAAKVDGASKARVLFKITVPLLSPLIAYVVITGFIAGFKEYSSIVGIFGETMGPAGMRNQVNTMAGFIYEMLGMDKQGTASAAALILFGIILVVTLIQLYMQKKMVHY